MAIITDAGGDAVTDEFGRPLLDEIADVRPASADYADALLALLPSGRIWIKSPGSTVCRVAGWLAATFAGLADRAGALLRDSPVGDNLLELLPEWETTLGLPDPCAGAQPTVALRAAAVRAKLAARGGQSIPYYVGVAFALGVPITITEFRPLRFEKRTFAGLSFLGPEAAHVWRVTAPASRFVPFEFGIGRFGDPFGSYGSRLLECTLNRIKPAHTILQFNYA